MNTYHTCVCDSQEHTQSVGCASFVLCVCVDANVNLQHAQHGARFCLHSPDGQVARMLPYHLDLQKCVCVVCSG